MTEEQVTQEEFQAFARKLEDFAGGLNPKEQSILRQILARASPSADVEGYIESHQFIAPTGFIEPIVVGPLGVPLDFPSE